MAVDGSSSSLPPELQSMPDARLRTIRAVFSRYDQANDGFIARTGMQRYMYNIFIVMAFRYSSISI